MKKLLSIWMLSIAFLLPAYSQQVYYVTTGDDNGEGSLRNTIPLANSNDTIRFLPEIDTVFLTSGELLLDKSLFIEGNENLTTIKRDNPELIFRLVNVEAPDSLTIYFKKMGFTGGYAPHGDQVHIDGYEGGAILVVDSVHTVILEQCEIANNRSGNGISNSGDFDFAGNGGHGGAIYSNSDLFLKDCVVENNLCGTGGTRLVIFWSWYSYYAKDGGSGGAVYCTSDLMLESCLFNANHAGVGRSAPWIYPDIINAEAGKGGDGGAVFFTGDSLQVISCEFLANKAGHGGYASSYDGASTKKGGDGGAMYVTNSKVKISNSVFSGNESGNGGFISSTNGSGGDGKDGGNGGAVSINGSTLTITSTDFSGNKTGDGGQGDPNYGGIGGNGGNGGGIFIRNATGTCRLTSCTITNNITGNGGEHRTTYINSRANGGSGGGLAYTETADSITLIVVNSDISLNKTGFTRVPQEAFVTGRYSRGGSGGGIYCPQGGISLVNVTCAGNKAGNSVFGEISAQDSAIVYEMTRGFGGGLYDTTGTSTLMNSLLANNEIYADSVPSENDLEGSFVINYSLIKNSDGFTHSGNNNQVGEDPLFNDYPVSRQLSESSPAIDSGNPDTSWLYLPDQDLTGNPRITNGIVDIGAYEYFTDFGTHDNPGQFTDIRVQSYPNPFRNSTDIVFSPPGDGEFSLIIFNSLGLVTDIFPTVHRPGGEQRITWDARDHMPGIYFYTLKVGNRLYSGKLILLK